jgi:hypothetical protein
MFNIRGEIFSKKRRLRVHQMFFTLKTTFSSVLPHPKYPKKIFFTQKRKIPRLRLAKTLFWAGFFRDGSNTMEFKP